MQLNLRAFIIMSILLANCISLLAQSILIPEAHIDNITFCRQGKFLIPRNVKLAQEDIKLIEKIIDLYQVSHNTLVDFTCPDDKVGRMRHAYFSDLGLQVPCMELSLNWKQLPYKQKEFILAHEMAHFVLGHCSIVPDNYIENIYKTYRDETMLSAAYSFSGMIALFFSCMSCEKSGRFGRIVIHSIIAGCACVYAISAMSLRISQSREKEADLKAVTMLGDALGGIEWLTDQFNKGRYGDRFLVDIFSLSSHPSDYARIHYLQEWQAKQNE